MKRETVDKITKDERVDSAVKTLISFINDYEDINPLLKVDIVIENKIKYKLKFERIDKKFKRKTVAQECEA